MLIDVDISERNSSFDHQTATDLISGKTVSDEAVRKFVQASRWAHDEKAALSAMLLSVRGVLASREAEIALLKKALMEAEAEVRQQDGELIRQLVEALDDLAGAGEDAWGEERPCVRIGKEAVTAGCAWLEGKP